MYSKDGKRPPSYPQGGDVVEECKHGLLEPFTLVLAGQRILEDAPEALPLYELNRGVANLGHAATEVELTRVERRVKTACVGAVATTTADDDSDGAQDPKDEEKEATKGVTPRIMARRRHIMDLVHPTGKGGSITKAGERMTGAVPFYVKPWTKRTHEGVYGLKKSPPRAHWRAFPILLGNDNGNYGQPKYDESGKRPLFEITAKGRGDDERYEWMYENGVVLAVEEHVGQDKQHRLRTVEVMEQQLLDKLVALWCCRMWEGSAAAQPHIHEGMEKGRPKSFPFFQLSEQNYAGMGVAMVILFANSTPTHAVRRRLRLAKEHPNSGRIGIGAGGAIF